ncbi:MAG: chitobiase/beta-hexosaminidase C-terminal domain-containing protein, partial [Armatimonadota bacterium]|nr:chitobiase/beta-hexosaminidase C-terminal domain-containing protein [Armatimonadota bacterium]
SNLTASTPLLRYVIPNGTTIPARGHLLIANTGYTLNSIATPDGTYTSNINDNRGIAVFNTSLSTNWTVANRLDAVGFNSDGSPTGSLLREGTGLAAIGTNVAAGEQFSLMRKLQCGRPQDTNVNANDFLFISTTGGNLGLAGRPSIVGTPNPQNLASPTSVPPCVDSFTPASGLVGATVTIYGANFEGAASVTFNNTPATAPLQVNQAGTRIVAVVPAGATTGRIAVATPAGTGVSASDFTVLFDSAAPTLTWGDITPAPNAAGWNKSAVEIPYTVADSGSGVASATPGSPLRFELSGSNQTQTVTATDNAGNSASFESPVVNIDLTAPATTATVDGTNNNGFYQDSAQVTLTATDALAGVAATYYTVDGGAAQTYTTSFRVAGDGTHTITFWSVDKAGNLEEAHTLEVKVDGTRPTTTATVSGSTGSNGFYRGAVTVTLSATDALSGVAATYYRVNDGATQTYAAPFSLSGDGTYTVTYWSVDKAGNAEQPRSLTIEIDATAPATTATLSGTLGANGWYTGAVQVTLQNVNETPGAVPPTIYYSMGGVTQTYTAPFTISGDGVGTLTYWSVDAAGNEEQPHPSVPVKIDGTRPTASFGAPSLAANGAGWNNSAVSIPYTASDNLSGVASATPGSPLNFGAEGKNQTKTVTVTDVASNNAALISPKISIDFTAPVTTHSFSGSGANGVYTGNIVVTLAATDNLSGVQATYYSVDGATPQRYGGSLFISGDGQHQLCYWSVDNADNVEAAHCGTIRIDSTPPTTTATLSGTMGSNGWYRSAVTVTLSASDGNGTGVATTYYRVDGGANQIYTGPFTISSDGEHEFYYWSVDNANNTEAARRATVRIDRTSPTTDATLSGTLGNNGWYRSAVQVTLRASDGSSGVATTYYSLDGGVSQTYTGLIPISLNGTHTVVFWSKDGAGNTEATKTLTMQIDATSPVVTVTATPASLKAQNKLLPVTLAGKITDLLSGVDATSATYSVVDEYNVVKPSGSITLKADGTYSFSIQLDAKRNSTDKDGRAYTITVSARDRAGNQGAASIIVKSV